MTSVVSVPGPSFGFRCDDGTEGTAQKILLATGLADDLPDLVGIREFYGHSVHHCLYCDGFEHRGRHLAAVGKGDKVIGLALTMKQWSTSVIACTDGDLLLPEALLRLQSQHIAVFTQPIAALTGRGRHLENIEFADGSTIASEALFFVTGCQQKSDLSARLGCSRDRKGGVTIDPVTEETSVPGVYVAGDASRDVLLVAVAIAEGAKAGVAINKALLREAGLL